MIDINDFNKEYNIKLDNHHMWCKDEECHVFKLFSIRPNGLINIHSVLKLLHRKVCEDIDCHIWLILEQVINDLDDRNINLVDD